MGASFLVAVDEDGRFHPGKERGVVQPFKFGSRVSYVGLKEINFLSRFGYQLVHEVGVTCKGSEQPHSIGVAGNVKFYFLLWWRLDQKRQDNARLV